MKSPHIESPSIFAGGRLSGGRRDTSQKASALCLLIATATIGLFCLSGTTLAIDREDTAGATGFTEHIIATNWGNPFSVFAADVDGDGDADVLSVAEETDDVAWWENDGAQNFSQHVIDTHLDGATCVLAIDVDADDDTDVVAAGAWGDDVVWYENDGSESFSRHDIDNAFDHAHWVTAVDLDSDGDVDVVGAAYYGSDIAWWENDGNENFAKHNIGYADHPRWGHAIDVDSDDDMDLLIAERWGNEIAWWENDGSESFTEHVVGSGFDGATGVFGTDLDLDGDIDILGAAAYDATNEFAWWENDGDESFAKHVIAIDTGPRSISAADLDSDGDMDVVGGGAYLQWFENDGSQDFTTHEIQNSFGDSGWHIYLADIDGDTDSDVLAAVGHHDAVGWWENQLWPQYTVSGQVDDSDGHPVAGVTVSTGYGYSGVTDAAGGYTIEGLPAGAYTLRPLKSGWIFEPTTRSVELPPDATGQDFTAYPPSHCWQETVIASSDPFPFDTDVYHMVTGDTKNDGTLDIAIGTNADWTTATIALYERLGDAWDVGLITPSSGHNAVAGMAIGDADNDGIDEFAYGLHRQSNMCCGQLDVKEWAGSDWSTETIYTPDDDWANVHAVADPDGDGVLELVASAGNGGPIYPMLFEYDGANWTHEMLSGYGSQYVCCPIMVATADVDDDGIVELIRFKESPRNNPYHPDIFSLIEWNGTAWQESNLTVLPGNAFGTLGGCANYAFATGDPDNDGVDEFVLPYWEDTDNDGVEDAWDDSVVIRLVDYQGGSWVRRDIVSYPKPGTSRKYALAIGDANNDGLNEIYAAGEDGEIRVYHNTGGAWLEGRIPSNHNVSWWNAQVADVGDDGMQDLVLAGRSAGGSEFALAAYACAGERVMYVSEIRLRYIEREPGRYVLLSRARILDGDGKPVGGATVDVEWTLPNQRIRPQSAQTSPSGVAKFSRGSFQTGEFRICVTDVTLEGYTYDPGQNWETCETLTIP